MATVAASDAEPATGATYPAVTRLDSLDLLRGLCALAVAVFHYHSWGGLQFPSAFEGFLAICGTYGVSVFFVLSGFSLAHGYGDRFGDMVTASALLRYGRRRVGRLAPLFMAVVLASLAGKLLSGKDVPDIYAIAANLTLVFGFIDPAQTPVIGGWSIGVEVVFYVVFPILLLLRQHMKIVVTFSIFLTAWTSSRLGGLETLEQGWRLYVGPANHLVFFATGAFAALKLRDRAPIKDIVGLALVAAILLVVVLLSIGVDELAAVTGLRRLALVPLSILLVIATSRIRIGRLSLIASLSGGASYPLYLIHPLFFFLAARLLPANSIFFSLILLGAIIVAVLIDYMIDKPLQRRIKAAGW
ncbi:acyltransferase [Roseomonas aeriglobus]|nr:acyltransferase [Roseomonas aeriglobus]